VITFTVYGKPAPAGSKRGFYNAKLKRVLITDANKGSRPWKNIVSAAGAAHYSGPLLDCPLAVTMVFYQPRPGGQFGTGRNAGRLKSSAPQFPTSKPDVLKLARGVEDALTGIVWRDDSRIVQETLAKRYGEPERVEITITPIDHAEGASDGTRRPRV
jgi:Holliday junction resolvase RusA-like endonuclease